MLWRVSPSFGENKPPTSHSHWKTVDLLHWVFSTRTAVYSQKHTEGKTRPGGAKEPLSYTLKPRVQRARPSRTYGENTNQSSRMVLREQEDLREREVEEDEFTTDG